MLAEFIEFLDHIYHGGYGQGFREDNPQEFYRQLAEFSKQHHFKNEI